MRGQKAAMVHGGLGIVFADRFPALAVGVESEGHRRRFGRLAVVTDSVVVVGIVGPAGEINLAAMFFRGTSAGRDPIARIARMFSESAPSDFRDVSLFRTWKPAHPTFAGRNVFRI